MSITEKRVNFKDIEKKSYKRYCQMAESVL